MHPATPRPALAAVLLALSLPAQQAPAWAAQAAAAIERLQQRDHVPGLSCAIGVGAAIPFQRGFGRSDVENDVPATADTVYRLASMSKPITAVLAMLCVQAGSLDLDRDVHEFVPGWPEKAWPVTTRLLLGNLGGVRHYRPGEAESTFHYTTQTEALGRFAADPLLHQPGTAYHYSTYGFALAASAIEQATKLPFPQLVHDRIAVPSGATTLQDDDPRRIVRGRAQGYVVVDGELRNSELMDSSYKLGGGGLCCSAPDYVRFVQALLGDRLVSPASRQVLWTEQKLTDGTPTGYGLGFRVCTLDGRPAIAHGGAQSRVSTFFLCQPDTKVIVVLLCNLEKVRLQPLAEELARLAAPAPVEKK